MAWCFSTRASVATVLTTHPCVSRCLRVKQGSRLPNLRKEMGGFPIQRLNNADRVFTYHDVIVAVIHRVITGLVNLFRPGVLHNWRAALGSQSNKTNLCRCAVSRISLCTESISWVVPGYCGKIEFTKLSWWTHDIETFSALLAPCVGNPAVR